MAKTTKKNTRSKSHPTAVQVISEVAVQSLNEVNMAATLTTQDLTDMVMSDREDQLHTSREQLEANQQAATKKLDELSQQLMTAANKLPLGKTYKNEDKVVNELTAFTGERHVIAVRGDKCDVEKQIVNFRICVVDGENYDREISPGKSSCYTAISVAEREEFLPFTPEMITLKNEIEETTNELGKIADQLSEIRRHLAALPRLGRSAKSQLVKAQLSGQLKTGHDILEVLSRNVNTPHLLEAKVDENVIGN
jgi:flagellar biosynthesis chaperone FliJ